MNFSKSFDMLIGHEGGYVNDPNDPGGETKYGISKRSYPDEDIAGMTLGRAREIYKRDFWDKCAGDRLPDPVNFLMFDAAVNSGVERAVKFLQLAVGSTPDGVLGPKTMTLVLAKDPRSVAAQMLGRRLHFMASLKTWQHFGRGWARRIADNLLLI